MKKETVFLLLINLKHRNFLKTLKFQMLILAFFSKNRLNISSKFSIPLGVRGWIPLMFLFFFTSIYATENNAANANEEIEEPSLPSVIVESKKNKNFTLPFDINGFWETRMGVRTQSDKYEQNLSIAESRLQLEIEKYFSIFSFKLVSDFLYDDVIHKHHIDLENGKGWLDLREANVTFSPIDFIDVKVGRQILTWGTGDLLFINDLFPKDWQSFFIGRDDEYLKAPSDAIKISFFAKNIVNLDFIYTPTFDSDRYINGERISYWNPLIGSKAGKNSPLNVEKPSEEFEDAEFAVRLYKNIKGYECALYGYSGYWKSPNGINPATGNFTFPQLNVYGFSARGKAGKGIGNFEFGYYDSKDDSDGDNPYIRNSELRFLVGYEQELYQIAKDFTVGVQYYVEHMLDYEKYKSSCSDVSAKDKDRQVITFRITKLLMNQNLTLSLFAYYSPSDVDSYLRPKINYKINDYWSVEAGGNIFLGKDDYTFFGQFQKNSNIYLATRISF